MHSNYAAAIRTFEGFTSQAQWDRAQFSNGFGTRAQSPDEVISPQEASRRFDAEIAKAQAAVETFAPTLDEGTKAALTSLTFNAGTAWMQSGLGAAVQAGDINKARSIFVEYNKAGGTTVPGLLARRLSEAEWFGHDKGSTPDVAVSNPDTTTRVAVSFEHPKAGHARGDSTATTEAQRLLGEGSSDSYLSWLTLKTAKALRPAPGDDAEKPARRNTVLTG